MLRKEPNGEPAKAQQVALPMIINGRIDAPGDWDVFSFKGRAGEKIVADVDARKLDSPLDSVLKLTDADGRQLAMNDDYADKGDGLSTHHADSFLLAELPTTGTYSVWLGDSQHKGGLEYGYRLRLSEPRPDFALRVVPSSVSVRAGTSAPITVYALRRDGFTGEIKIFLKDAPKGITINGNSRLPADKEQIKLTISAVQVPPVEPCRLAFEGRALLDGHEIIRSAAPADDMMQAFIYHHLVPARDFMLAVMRRLPPRLQLKYAGESPVKFTAGQTATLRFTGPRGPMLEQMQLALKECAGRHYYRKGDAGAGRLERPAAYGCRQNQSGPKGQFARRCFCRTDRQTGKRKAGGKETPHFPGHSAGDSVRNCRARSIGVGWSITFEFLWFDRFGRTIEAGHLYYNSRHK